MKNIILLSILSLTLFSACQKESLQPIENSNIPKLEEENYLQLSTIMKRYESAFQPVASIIENKSTRSSCFWTSIAAGSTNALNDAIANTCPSGTIYFEAGTHIQDEPVLITKSIKLVGADGARINVDAGLTLSNESGALPLNPIFHITNANRVLIQNLEINSLTDGGTAFLIEESHQCGFINNAINGFQMAMVNEKSNELVAINNTIVNGGLWQTGAVTAAHSIILSLIHI